MTRSVTMMTIDDALHYTDEQRAAITASYPAWERDARTKGIPVLGSGRVFPVAEQEIICDPFAIPRAWPQIVGVDFGWDHPFGAARCAWDRDADVFYVTGCYAKSEATTVIHAAALRPWGEWLPIAWPHDGLAHDKHSGRQLAEHYREQGLDLLPEHATHEAGGYGLEAGIIDMLDRMQTGRWKVFAHCQPWIAEFRLYHRKDGLIVKERDDVISASRYALMMKRHALVEPKNRQWRASAVRGIV